MAILGKMHRSGGVAAWLWPAVALAVIVALGLLPARAQDPEGSKLPQPAAAPAPSPAPELAPAPAPVPAADAAVAPPPTPAPEPPADLAPTPAAAPLPPLYVPAAAPGGPTAPDVGHLTMETGPVFPVAGGLEHHVDFGWTAAVLGREIISCSTSGTVFAEFGGEYETLAARSRDNRNTDVTATLPSGATQLLTGFNQTRLVEIDHLGLRGGFGWTWDPMTGDCPQPADGRLFLIGRIGLHGGLAHAAFHEKPTTSGLSALGSFASSNGGSAGLRLIDSVDSTEPYIGFTASCGVGLCRRDASLFGIRLGCVSLTAEVELGYEWNNLGQFDEDATLLSVSPKVTLGFSF